MKRRKRHTLLKFIILAVIAGGVVQYSGVLKDTDVFPEKIAKCRDISTENETADTEVPHGYAYETLTAEQKTVYDEVYRIILAHDSKVKVSTCDEKVLEKSYRSVIADHGGIFWVSGYNYTQYTMGKKIVSIDFSPSYTMERTERDSYQRRSG